MAGEFYNEGLTPEAGRGYARGMNSPEAPGGAGREQGASVGLTELLAALDRTASRSKALEGAMDNLIPGINTLADVMSAQYRQGREYKEEDERIKETEEKQSERTERELDSIARNARTERDDARLTQEGKYVLGLGRAIMRNATMGSVGESSSASLLKREIDDAKIEELVNKVEAADRANNMGSVRGEIAELSSALKKIIHEPELKEFGYMDVPSSFDELMQYIAVSEDSKFQPGGEFALYEVRYTIDKNADKTDSEGYVLEPVLNPYGEVRGWRRKQEIIPNHANLLRWAKEKAQYFINQNTFTPINLMQDISVPALNPLSIGYILNNDRFWTKDIAIPKPVEVEFDEKRYHELVEQGKAGGITRTPDGRYVRIDNKYVIEKKRTKKLGNLRDDLILTLFLTEWEHNSHVAYFSEGMNSEKPLREVMQKIYNTNYLTRFLGLELHEASDSKFHNRGGKDKKEDQVRAMLEDGPTEMKVQGAVGKAKQRLWAAYYFLAESSAAANGWSMEGGVNPFYEVLRGIDADGAELFYKSLVRQTLEQRYRDEVAGVQDVVDALNATDWSGRPDHPKRYDWEKVDIMDFIFLGGQELTQRLQKYNMSPADVQKALEKVREGYRSSSSLTSAQKTQREHQLDMIGKADARKQFMSMFASATDANGKPKMDFTQKDIAEKGAFHAFYGGNGYTGLDAFAVKFFARPFEPGGTTQDTNIFRNRRYADEARLVVRQAMRDVVVHTEKLDAFEAWWAEERSFRKTYITGISARNDVDAIGHDAWSKVMNTMAYRLRQANKAANFYGMPQTLFGPQRLGVNFLEGINYKMKGEAGYNTPLIDLIAGITETSGGTGIRFNMNHDIGEFELPGHVMAQFYADHFSNALSLWEMEQGPLGVEAIGNFVRYDNMGRPIYDFQAIKDFMDGTVKQSRYAWDNANIRYNKLHFGWTQETYLDQDKDGNPVAKTRMVFGVRSMKDFMFSQEIQQMGMFERKDLAGKARGEEESQMSRNVIGYLIAKQIQAHQEDGSTLWTADAIVQVMEGFRKYGIGALEMANGKPLFLSGYLTSEEILKILAEAQIILWKLYLDDYKKDALGGLADGIFGIMNDLLKELGASITMGKAA